MGRAPTPHPTKSTAKQLIGFAKQNITSAKIQLEEIKARLEKAEEEDRRCESCGGHLFLDNGEGTEDFKFASKDVADHAQNLLEDMAWLEDEFSALTKAQQKAL